MYVLNPHQLSSVSAEVDGADKGHLRMAKLTASQVSLAISRLDFTDVILANMKF